MTPSRCARTAVALLTLCALPSAGAEAATTDPPAAAEATCPLHATHAAAAERRRELDARGDEHMGFPQDATVHHFRLTGEGGVIEVTVRDAADATTLAQVRDHLQHIRGAFAAGDFSIPAAVHARVPPGVAGLRDAGELVTYRYEELPGGARVVLTGADARSRAAIHEFLRFQIDDHGTGDPHVVPHG